MEITNSRWAINVESGEFFRHWRENAFFFSSSFKRRRKLLSSCFSKFAEAATPNLLEIFMTIEAIDLLGDSIYDNQSYGARRLRDRPDFCDLPVHEFFMRWMAYHYRLPVVLEDLGMILSQLLERAFQLGGMMPSRMLLSCWSLAPLCWKPSLKCRKSG